MKRRKKAARDPRIDIAMAIEGAAAVGDADFPMTAFQALAEYSYGLGRRDLAKAMELALAVAGALPPEALAVMHKAALHELECLDDIRAADYWFKVIGITLNGPREDMAKDAVAVHGRGRPLRPTVLEEVH